MDSLLWDNCIISHASGSINLKYTNHVVGCKAWITRCKICSKKLGEKFFVKNDRVCCSVCYKVFKIMIVLGSHVIEIQDSKDVCAACKDKILDDHISCDNLVFHPKCMKVK